MNARHLTTRALVLILAAASVSASVHSGHPRQVRPYLVATDYAGKDIGAKVNHAIAALGERGGTIYIPPGRYSFATTISYSASALGRAQGGTRISLMGGGRGATVLTYTGTGHAIQCSADALSQSPSSGALSDFSLFGNGSTTSVGIYIQSCTGLHLDRLAVHDFGAAGIELDNVKTAHGPGWTERTYIGNVVAYNDGPDVWLHVSGGTNSFGYTTIVGSHLDGRALLVDSGASLYGSFIQFNSNSGGVRMVEVRGSILGCFIDINAENTSGAPSSYAVYVERGGAFIAEGMLRAEGLEVESSGEFYLYGHGAHGDPGKSSAGIYPGDAVTRPIAADDQISPSVLWAMSGDPDQHRGNALLMTQPSGDGRAGLRVLNGLTASSPAVASLDNSGVLMLNTTKAASAAPPGGVAFTSHVSTTASPGGAGRPPRTVAGYLMVNIGGRTYKIPYYAE